MTESELGAIFETLTLGTHPKKRKTFTQRINFGWVYVATDGLHHKIGHSQDVDERIRVLNTSSPYEIRLFYAFTCFDPNEVEATLHSEFAEQRIKGEWYRLTAENLTAIIARGKEILNQWDDNRTLKEVSTRLKKGK